MSETVWGSTKRNRSHDWMNHEQVSTLPAVIQDRTNYFLRRAPRTFPYAGVGHDSRGRYYDFKAEPDLIDTVLEDFVPHRAYEGVQRFFVLIRHINRPDAPFETTDCGLTQSLYQSRNSPFPDKSGWVGGRLMLMRRNLDQNCQQTAVNRLLKRFRSALRRSGRGCAYIGFVIGPFPTVFCSTGRRGFQIDTEFAMWGDSFDEAMRRFSDVVMVIEKAIEASERGS